MLILIFEIIAIVLVTARIVDIVEEKGRKGLLFKIATPAAWIVCELLAYAVGIGVTGLSISELTDPNSLIDPAAANAMFLLLLFRAAGALGGAAIMYLVARRLPAVALQDEASIV